MSETRRAITAAIAVTIATAAGMVGVLTLAESRTPPTPATTVTATVVVPGPTTTVTATATVRVTRTATPVSRGLQRLDRDDEAFLRCVVHRESRGNPRAQNPTSTASGLFQFLNGTWQAYARESGIGDNYLRAKDAPPSVQWDLARWVVKHKGRYPWKPTVPGTGC